jgi:hypothetical protein
VLRSSLSRFAIAVISLAGCVGKVGDRSAGNTPPGGTPPGGTPPGVASVSYAMVRLTNTQYLNTAHDLLPTVTFADPPLPNENVSSGFSDVGTTQAVTALVVSDYQEAAAAIASAVHDQIGNVLSCQHASTADEQSCAQSFIADFGKRAYRRPISNDESARLLALFEAQRASGVDFPSSMSDVVEAVLQSPAFLYRLEGGQLDPTIATVPLSSYELASRLSYFLTNSMPDGALMQAADGDTLQSADQIEAQARRLLGSARARDAVARFHYEWLNLVKMDSMTKDATAFPGFSASTAAALSDGTKRFLDYAFWEKNSLSAMLLEPSGFVTDATAPYYGVAAPGSSTPQLVALPDTQRAGLLTQPGLLAALAGPVDDSPVHRGVLVLKSFLCLAPPPPPPGVNTTPPALDPSVPTTTRQRLEASHAQSSCATCHAFIDNVGFGFENYDAVGQWRTKESGLSVDPSGSLTSTDIDGPFVGAIELSQKLAQSQQVANCVTYSWLRYALGLDEQQINLPAASPISAEFQASGGSFTDLLIAVVTSDTFRQLRVSN